MRLIDRYILREVAGIFIFGAAVITTLLVAFTHLFFVARLAADLGLPMQVSLMLLALRVPYLAPYSLPTSILLATLLTVGRLSERNEVIALRTSGWSLTRLAVPIIAAGVVVGAMTLAMNEYVVPRTETRYNELLAAALGGPARIVRENVQFREQVNGVESIFYARQLDTRDGTMTGVVVVQFQGLRPSRLIEAEIARYSPAGWVLENGALYLLGSSGGVSTRFEQMRIALKRTPPQIVPPRGDPAQMTIGELRAQIDRLHAAGENVARYVVNLHLKMAVPASSVMFALLAVPLGLRPHRSGRSTGLGLTVAVLLGYYLMTSITVTLGERGQLAPFWAAWAPNVVLAVTGSYLLWIAR
jgi:lipopolysaccharide export system permease protein